MLLNDLRRVRVPAFSMSYPPQRAHPEQLLDQANRIASTPSRTPRNAIGCGTLPVFNGGRCV
jgi:hypothetical protein